MVIALKCMRCNALRLIDSLSVPGKLEECLTCGGRDTLIMKTYDWNSLEDVDMDVVSKDEEDFNNCVGEFADEDMEEDEDECANGADLEECEECPNFEYCMGADSINAPKATCVEIKAMRTYQDNDKRSCMVEVCASKDGIDLYVFYEKKDNEFVFRVCDKSYIEYMEYDDNEAYPITIYYEITNEDKMIQPGDAEYFSLLSLVMDIGDKIVQGIRLPNVNK